MAIPPKEGHYTAEDFQQRIDKAIADMQWVSSQLAAMKAHPEQAKHFVAEAKDAAVPKDNDKDKDKVEAKSGAGAYGSSKK